MAKRCKSEALPKPPLHGLDHKVHLASFKFPTSSLPRTRLHTETWRSLVLQTPATGELATMKLCLMAAVPGPIHVPNVVTDSTHKQNVEIGNLRCVRRANVYGINMSCQRVGLSVMTARQREDHSARPKQCKLTYAGGNSPWLSHTFPRSLHCSVALTILAWLLAHSSAA